MKNNRLKYIDKLAKNKLQGHKVKPSKSWDSFNKSMNNSLKNNTARNLSKFSSVISVRALIIFSIVITLTGLGYFRLFNQNKINTADKIKVKNNIELKIAKKVEIKYIEKNNNTVIKPKEESTVIIKKQIVIRDTVYIDENKPKK